uniref:Uncharacterized protein n=1 Tax=viral metagenome TaxID=1070528 RepID=A0A6M3KL46_9ZZZZ
MNFRLIALNIRQYCPELSIPVIKERINIRYKQILSVEDWEFLYDSTTVNLIGITTQSTGVSVAVTNGQTGVTGTATTFGTDAITGYNFRIETEAQPYVVGSVTSDTALNLERPYGGSTAWNNDFSYYKTIYSPGVGNVAKISSIVYQQQLPEVSERFLNKLDPERSSTGTPTYWRNFSKTNADGIVSFEIWPILDDDYVVTVYYKKYVANLIEDTDTPVFRPEVLEAGALWDCFRIAFATTRNTAYIGLARDAQIDFRNLLRELVIEDLAQSSLPTSVRDVSSIDVFNDNFLLSHDVETL